MIDIHSHIIPFVDDGSSSLEDSLRMLKDEVTNGVDELICTPHFMLGTYDRDNSIILKNYEILKNLAKENGLNLHFYLGMEIAYTEQVDLIKMLDEKKLFTLGNSKQVLLEFNYDIAPRNSLEDIVFSFKVRGYQVVLAHVERYSWLQIIDLIKAKNMGALVQVNAASVVGKEGFIRKRLVTSLIKQGLVDFVASDIHSFRKNYLKEAFERFEDLSKNS